ncbi:hypothetical protein SAMN06273572_10325 [Monaibacterium marinum]|uniref:Uncharacterized protein n=1 Tax=Pontivivens marinum TaxID=1690039 RepID=A0A2C9CS08_9RHOB|nr:hypothetical protein [Monaibacterium marinum]SOH94000.1 hypothetical protein SAMN06273572_10325 [Monaibacterium marinum]
MTESDHNRLWLDNGVLRAHIQAGGFVPLELVLDGVVISRPVPRPIDRKPGYIEFEHPLPQSALSNGIGVLLLRKQGEETPLAALPLIIGGGTDSSIVEEVALLRAELELVKTVLRERLRRDI